MVPWHEAGEHAMSDVDVMVIGRAGLADLNLGEAAPQGGGRGWEREVNVTAYSPEEFRGEKIKSGDHFLAAVLRRTETVCERRPE